MKNIIQIAGIKDLHEALMLVDAGVDWLGFPLRLAVHQEDISESEAARIIRQLPDPKSAVLITYLSSAKEIKELSTFLGIYKIQLHGEIPLREVQHLRKSFPELLIIKSLVVRENNLDELLDSVQQFSPLVDAFITDTHDPVTGADGATGKTHDWNISARLVAESPVPVILAGGLTPKNVEEAILTVQPAGVDAHTGVEGKDGRKNPALVQAFVTRARNAFGRLNQ